MKIFELPKEIFYILLEFEDIYKNEHIQNFKKVLDILKKVPRYIKMDTSYSFKNPKYMYTYHLYDIQDENKDCIVIYEPIYEHKIHYERIGNHTYRTYKLHGIFPKKIIYYPVEFPKLGKYHKVILREYLTCKNFILPSVYIMNYLCGVSPPYVN